MTLQITILNVIILKKLYCLLNQNFLTTEWSIFKPPQSFPNFLDNLVVDNGRFDSNNQPL